MMMTDNLTPLGRLLEGARGSMSKRAAARAAGISEGRWRQVVTGVQKAGAGIEVPANPKRETVIAMARAVGVDVNEALAAAGYVGGEPARGDGDDATMAAIDADPAFEGREADREKAKAMIRLFRGDDGNGGGPISHDNVRENRS